MARIDTLTNFLTDIASAIKSKKGNSTKIKASEFDAEISKLENIEDYFNKSAGSNSSQYMMSRLIKKIPALDTKNVTNMQSAFFNFANLKTIPEIDTHNVTNMQSMFEGCTSLQEIPVLNADKLSGSLSRMFYNCINLREAVEIDTSRVTNVMTMYYSCRHIRKIPNYDTSKVTTFTSMVAQCISLIEIPQLDASSAISIQTMFNGCTSLSKFGGMINLGKSFKTTVSANYSSYKLDLSSCTNLTHESLMNVINGLYDIKNIGVKSQQLILGSTNLAKLTAEEIAIATNKGWSVS